MNQETSKKLKEIFVDVLQVPVDLVTDEFEYQDVPTWDSVGHLQLIIGIENTFKIELSSDEMLTLRTFKDASEIVRRYL